MRVPAVRLCLALLLGAAAPGLAQDSSLRRELRDSQQRLEQIRSEREQLQQEMENLRSHLTDASTQLANIERRVGASAGVLRELDFQFAALTRSVDVTTRELLLTRDRLVERKVVLQNRLRSIYKRGPLHAVRVLLSAESFGDLLNRYKYLHLIALYDRALIEEVGRLEHELVAQERDLQQNLMLLQQLRAEKLEEFAQLQSLEREQERVLRQFRQKEREAQRRLLQLARDESRLTNVIAELDRNRIEAERRRTIAGRRPSAASSFTTGDLGALAWPVDGKLAYRFGPERKSNGVVLRWNGIGISAPVGTPVRAVEAGTVVMAGPFEGYGPTVMVSHGGGYYTLYLYLARINVSEGDQIAAGGVIGTVGGELTPEGPHIEFQVRAPIRNGIPEPVDPLDWLQRRAAG